MQTRDFFTFFFDKLVVQLFNIDDSVARADIHKLSMLFVFLDTDINQIILQDHFTSSYAAIVVLSR